MEFVLNDKSIQILTEDQLAAFSYPDTANREASMILVSELFPWMEEVWYFGVEAGTERIELERSDLTEDVWNRIKINFTAGNIPEIFIAANSLKNPDRISISGKLLKVPEARVWSASNFHSVKEVFLAALGLRKMQVNWRETRQPEYLLSNPPEGKLPHIVLVEDLTLISLKPKMSAYVVFRMNSKDPKVNAKGSPEFPNMPETPLYWLLDDNPGLFDREGKLPRTFPATLSFFKAAQDIAFFMDRIPEQFLAMKPLLEQKEYLIEDSFNPGNRSNVIRYAYAAIPAGLSPEDDTLAHLLLREVQRGYLQTGDLLNARPFPMSSQTVRYFEAYTRIGRLVVSRQMDSDEGTRIMNDYIEKE